MDFDQKEKSKELWQVPKYGVASPQKVHEWAKGQVKNGQDYQESSPGFKQLEDSIRILTGEPSSELAEKQDKQKYTKLKTKRIKRNLREMVNSLSEVRYNPGFHAKNKDMHDFANTLNNVGSYWWSDSFADLALKKALQWAAICPCGYLEICYREIPGERGEQRIDLIPMSWFDVVMSGVPENGDFQQAYTVTLIKDLPIYLAHALFDKWTEKIKPDRETPKGWIERIKEKIENAIQDVFSTEPERRTAKNPTCRVYYQYVLDLSINKSGKTMKMGYEKVNEKIADGVYRDREIPMPWSYDVPSLGEMVISGYDSIGQPMYQPATAKQARIFPGRRLIIFTNEDTIYDGPMFDWHGKVPIIKIGADSWPFGDFSMMYDVTDVHDAINQIDRISMQTLYNRFNPSMFYNTRAMNPGVAKAARTDVQGQRFGYNGQETGTLGPMHPMFPKDFSVVEGWVENLRKYLVDDEDYEMGIRDIAALSKMKMGANLDSMEKALEFAGPIVKGISRDMEKSFRDLAEMFKYLVLQYMETPELMQILGPDGITPSNYDFDPGNLIPSHLPGENRQKPSIYSKMQRAKWQADHAKFIVQPGTLHEIVQTAQKMLYLQLWRQGFQIDPETLSDVLRLGNFGVIEGTTMKEKWFNWKKEELIMMAELAKLKQELMGEEGGGAQPNAGKLGAHGGQKGTGGRPSSGQASPKMDTKDGGTRPIVRESR